jgi:hypothetical protein
LKKESLKTLKVTERKVVEIHDTAVFCFLLAKNSLTLDSVRLFG